MQIFLPLNDQNWQGGDGGTSLKPIRDQTQTEGFKFDGRANNE